MEVHKVTIQYSFAKQSKSWSIGWFQFKCSVSCAVW